MLKEKKIFSIFLLCVSVFLFVSPYFILPSIYAGRDNWLDTAPPNAVLLELWNIDTFEGGSGSRAKYLEHRAYNYQKETFSTYVLVRSLTVSQAKAMLSGGAKPDLVSFGIGSGEIFKPFCEKLSPPNFVRADLLQCGVVGKDVLAVPWCVGGYCLCADESVELSKESLQNLAQDKKVCTGGVYNVANLALSEKVNVKLNNNYTQFEAYEAYLRGEYNVLLGTQRDFYRLNRKVENGVLGAVNFSYLTEFTDLIQVIAVCNAENKAVAEKFVEYLLTPSSQMRLCDIGLFSVTDTQIYEDNYREFELAIKQPKKVLSVFTPSENIKSLQGRGDD